VALVHLPRSLVTLFPDAPPRQLEVDAADVGALVHALDARWPGMWDRVCEPGPRIREHINVFVDGERRQIDTPLTAASVVHIIPAVAGG
jgi:sulfur-carrier protein